MLNSGRGRLRWRDVTNVAVDDRKGASAKLASNTNANAKLIEQVDFCLML